MKTLLLLFPSLFFVACSSSPKKLDVKPKNLSKLNKFIGSPITRPSNKNILFSLAQYYGAPQHQEFSRKPSAVNPRNKEKVYTLVYDGFEINVAERGGVEDRPYYLRRLVVHNNSIKLPYGVKIGESKESLQKLFGEPKLQSQSDNSITYCAEKSAATCVRFYLKDSDNTVQRIIWDYDAGYDE